MSFNYAKFPGKRHIIQLYLWRARILIVLLIQTGIYNYNYPGAFQIFWVNRIWVNRDIAFREREFFMGILCDGSSIFSVPISPVYGIAFRRRGAHGFSASVPGRGEWREWE